MRRQFLRVYLGIALVLVLAAAATMWLVEREFRVGLSQRFERAMVPRAAHIKERLLQVEALADKDMTIADLKSNVECYEGTNKILVQKSGQSAT